MIGTCGTECAKCEHMLNEKCGGCREIEGKPFWGECELYACAAGKQLLHCGFCADYPCDKLSELLKNEGSNGIEVINEMMKSQSVVQSRCGLLCNECDYREECNCGGCIETNGHPFHGECPVATCCQGKGYTHCGQCPDMPCEQLRTYSCDDKEHGDNPPGARLGVLRYWQHNKE